MLTINLFNGLVYGALLIVMSSGLALIYGLRRVVNFAHGALYMLGAYIGYSVATYSNFWVAMVAAPMAMAVVGVLLDRYCFRLLQDREPLNVMLVTFGLLLILEDVVVAIWGKANYSLFTPELLNFSVKLGGNEVPAYRIGVIGIGAAVAIGLTLWLRYSRMGLFVRAASTDPITTSMQGVNTDMISATVVGLGSALAGLAGVVAAPFHEFGRADRLFCRGGYRRPGLIGRRLHCGVTAGHDAGHWGGLLARGLGAAAFRLYDRHLDMETVRTGR
jgi:branched-chain amino acid transport system permease protein